MEKNKGRLRVLDIHGRDAGRVSRPKGELWVLHGYAVQARSGNRCRRRTIRLLVDRRVLFGGEQMERSLRRNWAIQNKTVRRVTVGPLGAGLSVHEHVLPQGIDEAGRLEEERGKTMNG